MTVLTGASGMQVDVVWHVWEEDLLLIRKLEISGISIPNFVLIFLSLYPVRRQRRE